MGVTALFIDCWGVVLEFTLNQEADHSLAKDLFKQYFPSSWIKTDKALVAQVSLPSSQDQSIQTKINPSGSRPIRPAPSRPRPIRTDQDQSVQLLPDQDQSGRIKINLSSSFQIKTNPSGPRSIRPDQGQSNINRSSIWKLTLTPSRRPNSKFGSFGECSHPLNLSIKKTSSFLLSQATLSH